MFWVIPLFFVIAAIYEAAMAVWLLLIVTIVLLVFFFRKMTEKPRDKPKCTCRERGYPRPYHSARCYRFQGYEPGAYKDEKSDEANIPEL